MSDSLRPHGPHSPWNSPGQNTGVGSLSLHQQIFSTLESNRGFLHCRRILYQLSYQRHSEPSGQPSGEALTCQFRRLKRRGFDPWVWNISCRQAWWPTPEILLGESGGQRSLAGSSQWGCKDSGTTEAAEHTCSRY